MDRQCIPARENARPSKLPGLSPHALRRLPKRAAPALPDRTKDGALEKAKAGGYTYLIYPVILYWEDRATEWSGIPDKITVEISVIDVATGAVLNSARIEGKSKWATLGGDHLQDLLEKPLTDYARTLFP